MPPPSLAVLKAQEPSLQEHKASMPENIVTEHKRLAYSGFQGQQQAIPDTIGSSEESEHGEEGEISDGEVEEPETVPITARPQNIADNHASRHNAAMPNPFTRSQRHKRGAINSQEANGHDSREDSASSYTPPPVSPLPFQRDATNLDGLNEAQLFLGQISAELSNSSGSKKGKAKDALKSLASYKITYRQLQREGFDEHLLRELYSELGILDGLPINIDDSSHTPRSGTETTIHPHTVSTDLEGSKSQPGLPQMPSHTKQPAAAPLEVLREGNGKRASPSLERKDRIAQLLAAKTGRLPSRLSPNPSSPQILERTSEVRMELGGDSPASVSLSEDAPSALHNIKPALDAGKARYPAGSAVRTTHTIVPQAEPAALQHTASYQQIPLRPELIVADLANSNPSIEVSTTGLQRELQAAASTRLLRHRGASPFAIPGLFMTSAELEQLESPQQSGALTSIALDSPGVAGFGSEGSLKRVRSAGDMDVEDPAEPDRKRPLLVAQENGGESSLVRSLTPDDASEGEILEDDAGIETTNIRLNGSFETTSRLQARPQPLHPLALAEPDDQSAFPKIDDPNAHMSAPNTLSPARKEDRCLPSQVVSDPERDRLRRNPQNSPWSSTASTPTVPRPTSQSQTGTTTEPVLQAPTATLSSAGVARPSTGPSTTLLANISGSEALAARAAHLKAELMRQRMLRQQAAQNAKPDEDAQRRQARLRLAEKQAELTRIRADEERREEERREARIRQEALQEEMLRLEAELEDQTHVPQENVAQTQHDAPVLLPSADDTPIIAGEESSSARETLQERLNDHRDDDPQDHDYVKDNSEGKSPLSIPASDETEANDYQYVEAEHTEIVQVSPKQADHSDEDGEELSPMQSQSAASGSSGDTSAEIDDLYQQALHQHENASVDHDGHDDPDGHYSSDRSDSMDVDDQSEGSASMDDSGSDTYEPNEEVAEFQEEMEAESDGYDAPDQFTTLNEESALEAEVFEPHNNVDEDLEQNEAASDSYDPQDVTIEMNEVAPAETESPAFAITTMSLDPQNTAAIARNSIDSSRITTPDDHADTEYVPEASEPNSLRVSVEQYSNSDEATLNQAS